MKQFKILWLLIAVLALSACGGDDDEDTPSAKIDSALIGTWVKFNPNDDHEINAAFIFKAKGDVFILSSGIRNCYGGTFYTDNGVIHANVSLGKMSNLENLDNFDWWSINSDEQWDLKYTITGNNIKLTRLQDNQSWSLQRFQTNK